MKNIRLFAVSAVGTVFAAFITWWFSLGYYQPAEHWLKDVYFAKEHWAESINKPKIIITSGSNSLFGLDSPLLEQITGKPVANLAGHAGLPLEFLLSKAKSHARQGDVVVMPLEFGYYNESSRLTAWQMSNMESWGHEYIKGSVSNLMAYFRHASLIDAIGRLQSGKSIPGAEQQKILEAVALNSDQIFSEWAGYSFKSMNSSGDILVENTGKTFDENTNYTKGEVSEHALELLDRYSKDFKLKGVSLVLTWPTTIKNPEFDLSLEGHRQRIESIRNRLFNRGLSVICSPVEFQFDRSNFLDTAYHLNYKGAVQRTINLGECLNGRAGEFSAKEIYAERKARAQEYHLTKAANQRSLVLNHLEAIVGALREYHKTNNSYPVSDRWDGLFTLYGTSSSSWIKGLVPKYIPELPRDPRMNDNGNEQYIYRSDGQNFKLVSHGRPDCELFRRNRPDVVDPARGCSAVGFWTDEAKAW